ncbi:MAG: MmgE/PrpD family protein [Burkholderiaceae bacterium]
MSAATVSSPGSASDERSLTDALAARLLTQPIDAAARARAARHLLDWLACALAGLNTDTGRALQRFGHTKPLADAPMPALGVGPLDRESALLINGALGNILEMDDIHRTAVLHPGPVIAPLVLTLAAERGAGGHACLDALVRGYEAMIRVGQALGRGHYRYWHPTATAGAFGAAAAAGSLLGLSAPALRDAMGHAGSVAGGLWQTRHEPSMTKSWHNARAAQHGLLAAELAAQGFTAPHRILEGESGLFAAMCTDPRAQAITVDAPWALFETGIKPWPACRHAHAALEAALCLRAQLIGQVGDESNGAQWIGRAEQGSDHKQVIGHAGQGSDREQVIGREGHAPGDAKPSVTIAPSRQPLLNARHVRRVLIETYDEAIRFCDKPAPITELEAKFSLQQVVAHALLYGAPGLNDFGAHARELPDIRRLRECTTVQSDEAFSAAFPNRYGAAVSVWLDRSIADATYDKASGADSGEVLRVAITDALGDPARPLDDAGLQAKASNTMRWAGLTETEINTLGEACLALADDAPLEALLAPLRQWSARHRQENTP